ncbi:HAD family acid phosphatase [Kineosporia sp. NBRC 101731]|uniref:HAD family acid phosphatase n=1 Tax=Kineosporia sp. NBRC 101731 TaxID=3032199 RepID=UPI0024A1480B|nr:HAD family acid phosphatase [Kineosporia sp. NBRC 101731]GLY29148.1 hypothetical protein Kisp02_25130 [Kineosporia sp. NBRC 101731]
MTDMTKLTEGLRRALHIVPSGYPAGEVREYYGDDGSGRISPDSAYSGDLRKVLEDVHHHLGDHMATERAALVLDVDDTALSSYDYGASCDFDGYTQGPFVQYLLGCRPQAVSGMPELTSWAAAQGFTIFYITSRPDPLRDVTLRNLREQGYEEPAGLFTKPAGGLSTVVFKSGVRADLAAQGWDLVANVGDQQSDLDGGHARRTFLVPNRMYLLP